jgi:ABC-type phosphate/phosphonate transport system substrate-binding protein
MEERRTLLALACLVLGVVVAACGSPSAPSQAKQQTLSVQIVPSISQLAVNTSQQFSIVYSGVPAPLGPGWSSSDPSVAAVDQNGLVKALSPGTMILSVGYGGKSDRRQLQVVPQN